MTLATEQAKTALLDRIGIVWSLGAYVVSLAFLNDGILAAALGDGRAVFLGGDRADAISAVPVHDGACLSMAIDPDGHAVLTGGDDGRLMRTPDASGQITEILSVPGRWVEPTAVSPASGLCAAATGKAVHLFARDGARIATFDHPNTVGGLAFDPKGRRLVAAHYGGVSLWSAKSGTQEPRRLAWPGSHLALTWSPDGKYIVTAMQENELHGWRVRDGSDIRLSGYPAKVKSMSWLPKGRYLATGGAESVVCWPFHGKDGSMDKAPLDLGWGFEGVVTVVAAHPRHELVAAGYEDGAIIFVQIGRLHPALIKGPGDGPVTALAWSADGHDLALGMESGLVGHLRMSDWRVPQA